MSQSIPMFRCRLIWLHDAWNDSNSCISQLPAGHTRAGDAGHLAECVQQCWQCCAPIYGEPAPGTAGYCHASLRNQGLTSACTVYGVKIQKSAQCICSGKASACATDSATAIILHNQISTPFISDSLADFMMSSLHCIHQGCCPTLDFPLEPRVLPPRLHRTPTRT